MINYEHGMLVLNSALNKQDQEAINQFLAASIKNERERIYQEITKKSDGGHVTIALFNLEEIIKL
jgi:hypothetical protein